MPSLPVVAQTTLLLTASNVFMTCAWYAHLRDLSDRLRRIAALARREPLKLDCAWAGLCLVGAVYFMFRNA